MDPHQSSDDLRLLPPGEPLGPEIEERLGEILAACPDLAFAHLADVEVTEEPGSVSPALFVWLRPESMYSIRAALNLVSEGVARALPADRYLDVVILNSAPELLASVEGVGTLVADNDPEERSRARAAALDLEGYTPLPPRRRWWWSF